MSAWLAESDYTSFFLKSQVHFNTRGWNLLRHIAKELYVKHTHTEIWLSKSMVGYM